MVIKKLCNTRLLTESCQFAEQRIKSDWGRLANYTSGLV